MFNRSLKVGEFPSGMKLVYVTPVHTKCNRYDKSNYGPVSILSNLSKAIERCFYYHYDDIFDTILSKYQCTFRKGHCLGAPPEKWRESIDQRLESGILLTDPSKVVDCLSYSLFIAELFGYGFDNQAQSFVYDYLRNRKQRTKIVDNLS